MKSFGLELSALALFLVSNGCNGFSPSHSFTSLKGKLHRFNSIPVQNSDSLSPFQRKRAVAPSKSNMSMSIVSPNPSIIASIKQTISILSKTTVHASSTAEALDSITSVLSTTPPLIYFCCLIVAGFGVPISEDALCIFAGTILPSIWTVDPGRRTRLLAALYAGVVLSDCITFSIGKVMRTGVLEPIRKRMKLRTERVTFCDDDEPIFKEEECDEEEDGEICVLETPQLKKSEKILSKLESAGDYAGLVIRLSVGMRTPMMLLAGFSGKVPFTKYMFGTCVGGLFSLSLQLLLGFTMRNNPAAVIGAIAGISSLVVALPVGIAFVSWVSLVRGRYMIRAKAD